MDGTPAVEKTTTRCPYCNTIFAVRTDYLGRVARCPHCQQKFRVQVHDIAPAIKGPAQEVPGKTKDALCPICQSAFTDSEANTQCPDCHTRYHKACWEYNQGCGIYGCALVPEVEKLNTLEIPAAYWGQEDKACPACGKKILAAAMRCRHCGQMFASAQPQDQHSYQAQTAVNADLPGVKKASIWLLVFSVVPCSAPIAALVGVIWYFRHAAAIRKLSPPRLALCKIAVGLALLQSLLMLAAAMMHALVG